MRKLHRVALVLWLGSLSSAVAFGAASGNIVHIEPSKTPNISISVTAPHIKVLTPKFNLFPDSYITSPRRIDDISFTVTEDIPSINEAIDHAKTDAHSTTPTTTDSPTSAPEDPNPNKEATATTAPTAPATAPESNIAPSTVNQNTEPASSTQHFPTASPTSTPEQKPRQEYTAPPRPTSPSEPKFFDNGFRFLFGPKIALIRSKTMGLGLNLAFTERFDSGLLLEENINIDFIYPPLGSKMGGIATREFAIDAGFTVGYMFTSTRSMELAVSADIQYYAQILEPRTYPKGFGLYYNGLMLRPKFGAKLRLGKLPIEVLFYYQATVLPSYSDLNAPGIMIRL